MPHLPCGFADLAVDIHEAYNYDALGDVVSLWQCAPYNCGTSSIWATPYTYDLASDVTSWTHPSGFTATNSINTAQEITGITQSPYDSTHPQNVVLSATYTAWGALSSLKNGCVSSEGQDEDCTELGETYTYNNRLQPIVVGNADFCLVYNYYTSQGTPTTCNTPPSGTGDNGRVLGFAYADVTGSRSHTETFGYDALNRLTSGVAAGLGSGTLSYNLTLSYDRYGNMTCVLNRSTQGPCPQLSYSTSPYNNRITSSGYTYDAAGNMTDDGTHSYQWDAEGRLISVDNGSTESNTYNALGEEVEGDFSTYGYVEQVFDTSGQTLGEYSSSGWNNHGVPYWFPRGFRIGSQIVAFNACCPEQTGFVYWDALQSAHEVTDYTGNELMDRLFYPWGQPWEMWGTFENEIFAGLDSADGETGFYGAMFRQYNSTVGRWMSPDPADLAAVDLTNPQSLNRYAYVGNNPTTSTDPLGLFGAAGPMGCDPFTGIGCGPEGGAGGTGGSCDPDSGECPPVLGPVAPIGVAGGGGSGGGEGASGASGGSGMPPGVGTGGVWGSGGPGFAPVGGQIYTDPTWIFRIVAWGWPWIVDIGEGAAAAGEIGCVVAEPCGASVGTAIALGAAIGIAIGQQSDSRRLYRAHCRCSVLEASGGYGMGVFVEGDGVGTTPAQAKNAARIDASLKAARLYGGPDRRAIIKHCTYTVSE